VINILHVVETSEPGGAETVLVEIATNLPARFRSLGCVFSQGWTSAALEKRNVPVFEVPLRRSFDLSWVHRLIQLIRQHKIHLIHSHEFTANCYSTLAARLAHIPIVCTVHGRNYYPQRYYRRLAYRWVARNADALVAVSKNVSQFLQENIGIRHDTITTIWNGIDLKPFTTKEADRREIRRVLNIKPEDFVVINVAALFDVKAQEVLLKAAAPILEQNRRTIFLIAGEGPREAYLKQLAMETGIANHVRFLGFRDDVPSLLRAADVFVLCSNFEGLPLSVIEAMATGLPVVATNVGGIAELVEHGTSAYLVPPKDPRTLARGILHVMSNSDKATRLGKEARRRARSMFSLHTMVNHYVELYSSLLERNLSRYSQPTR
jgi:sugar transferase (PEP-CTERM/EpsH1 system associated)